jgi:RND family efflux transporter MFP subunit
VSFVITLDNNLDRIANMKRWMIFAGAGVALVVIGGAAYLGYRSSRAETQTPLDVPATVPVERGDVIYSVSGPGHAADIGETTLEAGVSAPVEQLLVRPGDAVKAGQLLAALGNRAHFEAAASLARVKVVQERNALATQQSGVPLAQARQALTQAQAACDQARNERDSKNYARTDQATLDIAHANAIVAQNALNDAESRYEGVKDRDQNDTLRAELLSEMAAARQNRDRAIANYNYLTDKPSDKEVAAADAKLSLASAQLAEAQRAYDQVLNGSSPDLALAAANLSDAEDQAASAEADLKSLQVSAPFDGVVTDVKVSVGQTVSAGSPLLVLTNPKTLEAVVTVVEEDLPLVKPDQVAKLFFDALPQETVTGVIARVVPKRIEGDQVLYPIYITIPHLPAALVAGMTVDAQIVIQQKTDVLRLPRTALRAQGTGKGLVQVWNGLTVENRTVQTGLRGDSYVEIVAGLKEGERVVSK